jgi:hypothetical protein
MSFRHLRYGYHESFLESYHLGSGREITLEIQLSSYINPSGPTKVLLKFLSIRNFEEVKSFFDLLQAKCNQQLLVEVEGILYTEGVGWVVVLVGNGYITIKTPKMPQET